MKISTPHRPLTPIQEDGIRAVHAELDRYYRAQLGAAQILAGIDEMIRALALPVPSPMYGDHLINGGALLLACSALQDAIQGQHYGVLYPSLSGVASVRAIRADVSADLAEAVIYTRITKEELQQRLEEIDGKPHVAKKDMRAVYEGRAS